MHDEQTSRAAEESCCRSKEDTLWGMVRQFYCRKMLSIILITWIYALIFTALAIFSGIMFFEVDTTRYQIMYAAIFVCSIQFVALMKIFSWQMIHRNRLLSEMRKLAARIDELKQT